MFKRIGLIVVCLAVLGLAGSVPASAAPVKKLQVVTTIFPLYDFARTVGGERVNVYKLLPAGVEAHTFEARPQDIVRIARADVFIYTGSIMEPWVPELLRGIANKHLVVVDASHGLTLMTDAHDGEDAHADTGETHEHGGKDPHIWLDFSYDQHIVQAIADAFSAADPAGTAYYMQNARAYRAALAELDQRCARVLASAKIRTIIYAGHFAFGYFAQRYHLDHVSPYPGFSPNAEPTPRRIQEIIATLRRTGSHVIYHEELINPTVAHIIAEETGARLDVLHGAHNVSPREMARGITFLDIMNENLKKLEVGLACQHPSSN